MISTDLDALAAHLGIAITEHHGGQKGYYTHSRRTISLRAGLLDRARRTTLAHELAHALAGDTTTPSRLRNARQEHRADKIAAQLLISPHAYEEAETLVGPHPGALARELGVTTHMIRVWRTHHERNHHGIIQP